jgi:hypothetical protein
MQSAQTLPHVVSFPQSVPAKETITQTELGLFLSLCARLNELEKQISAEEQSLRARLESGVSVEAGRYSAELRENFRRNVSWKRVAIRLANRLKLDGQLYCARVLASTKPSRTVNLIVSIARNIPRACLRARAAGMSAPILARRARR